MLQGTFFPLERKCCEWSTLEFGEKSSTITETLFVMMTRYKYQWISHCI